MELRGDPGTQGKKKEVERYPDQLFDENLYKHLLELPDGSKIDIEFVKKIIWDEAVEFNVPEDKVYKGMQANMFALNVFNEDGYTVSAIVKRVVPKELPEKPSKQIWLGFIESVRHEIDFYSELLKPQHESIRHLFPKVYFSSGTPPSMDDNVMETSFCIIMENLNNNYYQTAMMDKEKARHVMESLAQFHAHFWRKVEGVKRGGFWVLERRLIFPEVEESVATWNDFVDRFPHLETSLPDVRSLGEMMRDRAGKLDRFVSERTETRIHGDAKGWNFFFGGERASNKILFIDMQWTGSGHPLQDVAYALTTTSDEETLQDMDELVDYYVCQLQAQLSKKNIEIDEKELRDEFDTVWLDYVRVIVMGLWKRLNPDSMEKNKTKVGPSMINRSWPHVWFIVNRMYRLLKQNQEKIKI